ncbi:MAG: hypothetical protein JW874_01655 [Spirochaetales bacterium]|nr:hypothetical protein [Spirochaetales bacterium]
MKKVICIGGPPMIGKSTAAVKLAARLEYACVSTDDLGEAVRALIKTRELNPFAGTDYRKYYISASIGELIDDTRVQHRKTWPAIKAVIKAHASWGRPLVLEGWNLYPEYIRLLALDNVVAFWLAADNDLLRERIEKNTEFYNAASNPELLIRNFTARSEWYCRTIRAQAEETGQHIIEVSKDTTPEQICNSIAAELEL